LFFPRADEFVGEIFDFYRLGKVEGGARYAASVYKSQPYNSQTFQPLKSVKKPEL
jgi:hypothetical protein